MIWEAVERIGYAVVVYGVSRWSVTVAIVLAGLWIALEAYALKEGRND